MSRLIYLHMVKNEMLIYDKHVPNGQSKDKRISQKPHIKYNLTRHTK